MSKTIEIAEYDTATGSALVIWDETDPSNPGYFLRYTDRHGNQVDRIMESDADTSHDDAEAEAQTFLRNSGLLADA